MANTNCAVCSKPAANGYLCPEHLKQWKASGENQRAVKIMAGKGPADLRKRRANVAFNDFVQRVIAEERNTTKDAPAPAVPVAEAKEAGRAA